MMMRYHRDKYGREIKYAKYVWHDDGTRLEVFGAGMYMPGVDDMITCWRPSDDPRRSDMPICWVSTKELSVRYPWAAKLSAFSLFLRSFFGSGRKD
jgi:hypothetical protein